MIQEGKIGDFSLKRKNWAEEIRRGYREGEGGGVVEEKVWSFMCEGVEGGEWKVKRTK